ncbi:hypothetical protein Bint_1251 [Brachyspira intermedia PWS/A]|uniref:Uncharacterized protein n=1 Tax=Brachyspira intermedia (strain ATCC 51140 / PWS/A) TaxID=1045858 RepID=G0ENJ1_BRAIP|nr:hypothetical protein Bint_1251 [Brachyspira intermedia PWS/A]
MGPGIIKNVLSLIIKVSLKIINKIKKYFIYYSTYIFFTILYLVIFI